MAAFTETPADDVGITDSAAAAKAIAQTVTDAVGITDSVATARVIARTVTDSVGVTDSVTRVAPANRTVTDSVGVTDAASPVKDIPRTVTDPVGIADSQLLTEGFDMASIDGATTLVGVAALELFDPTGNPLELYIPSIDGASAPAGVLIRTQTQINNLADDVEVYAELRDSSGTLLSALTDQISVEWQDPLDDLGIGTLTISRHATDANLIVVGTEIWCYLYGAHVFTFVIEEPPQNTYLEEGDEAVEVLSATGPGRNTLTQDALVYPPLGIEDPMHPAHRLYSFASFDYLEGGGPIGVGGGQGWETVVSQKRADEVDDFRYQLVEWTYQSAGPEPDVVEEVPSGAPLEFPDPASAWVWGTSDRFIEGLNFFRSAFLLTERATVAFAVSASNYYTFYLNGTPILAENQDPLAWQKFKRVDLELDIQDNGGPRVYSVAAVVNNVGTTIQAGWSNPGGFLCSIFAIDPETGDFAYPLLRTEPVENAAVQGWVGLDYPASYPGWTPGAILIDMFDEAQARGELSALQYDFTGATDSFGNPWPVTQGFSMPVGTSIYDALNSLVEQGWIHYRLAPGGLVLQAFDASWNPNSGVTLTEGVNIAQFSFESQSKPANRLFCRWQDGVFQLDDAASQATYGIKPRSVTIDAATEIEAIRRGQVILDNVKDPQETLQAEIAPTSGDLPYTDFFVGDRLTVPTRAGGTSSERLLALSVSHDEIGKAIIGAEFQTRIFKQERQNEELVDQLGSTVTGSDKVRWSLYDTEEGRGGGGRLYGSANRAIFSPAATRGQTKFTSPAKTRQEVNWSWPGTVDIVGIDPSGLVAGPPWIAPSNVTLIGVTVALTTAASVPYSGLLYIDDVYIGTYTLGAGLDDASYPILVAISTGQQIHFVAQETTGTSDGYGLSISLRYQAAN